MKLVITTKGYQSPYLERLTCMARIRVWHLPHSIATPLSVRLGLRPWSNWGAPYSDRGIKDHLTRTTCQLG